MVFYSVCGAVGVKGKSLHYLLMLIEPSGFGEDENFPSPDGVEFHTRRFKFIQISLNFTCIAGLLGMKFTRRVKVLFSCKTILPKDYEEAPHIKYASQVCTFHLLVETMLNALV